MEIEYDEPSTASRRSGSRAESFNRCVSVAGLVVSIAAAAVAVWAASRVPVQPSAVIPSSPAPPIELGQFARQTVLFIVAHPDDVVGAAGGLVASLTAATVAAKVHVLVLTNGNAGCRTTMTKAACSATRTLEELACDAVLGVPNDNVYVLQTFNDNHLWDGTYATVDIVSDIVSVVRRVQPFAVFTFYPDPQWQLRPALGYDDMGFHPDHQRTGFLTASAVAGYAVSDPAIYNVSYGAPWSPSQLWFFQFAPQLPSACLYLTPDLVAVKKQAFLQHKTQYTNASLLTRWVEQFSSLVGEQGCNGGAGALAEGYERYL